MTEDDDAFVFFRELVDCFLEKCRPLTLNDMFVGLIRCIGELEGVLAFIHRNRFIDGEGVEFPFADVVDAAVRCDLVEPC